MSGEASDLSAGMDGQKEGKSKQESKIEGRRMSDHRRQASWRAKERQAGGVVGRRGKWRMEGGTIESAGGGAGRMARLT